MGRSFNVECDESNVKRLLLSVDALERRMSEFFNGDSSDIAGYTHALVLTSLKMEWHIHNFEEDKQRFVNLQESKDNVGLEMEDLKKQNEILNETIEDMAKDRNKNIEKVHEIEQEIDVLVRFLSGRENN